MEISPFNPEHIGSTRQTGILITLLFCAEVAISKKVISHQNCVNFQSLTSNSYDEESDHSYKAVRKTHESESGHMVSEEVK